jgi:hypothetical protein
MEGQMRARPDELLYRRIDDASRDAPDRGLCLSCGAHVPCRIGLATVGGCCGVCGSVGAEPMLRGRYQRGAAPNISPSRPATV